MGTANIRARHARKSSNETGYDTSFPYRGPMALIVAAAMLVASIALAFMLPAPAEAGAEDAFAPMDEELMDVPEQFSSQAPCEHVWITTMETIQHAPLTHEVHHDATYEERLVGHTICNECGQVIDGVASSHAESTGHAGYTTKVPVLEREVSREAWTETVVDEPAWTETVENGAECVVCGERRGLQCA